ncbi:hypothetical protein ONZ45_g6531 [Pleurotus djamor]|nr:hypothetical protein ONZ45_g6531 [Pleurotus djamor]
MANVKHERIRSVLLQIVESSRSLQTKTTKDDSIPVRLNAEHNPSRPPSLNFPPLHDFSLELGSMGVIEPISKKVADAFRSRCNQLQALVNDRLCEMQHRCSPSVQPLLRSYLQNFYNENVDEFKAELLRSIEQHRSKFTVAHNKSANKPLFNSDFVPFLEKYFEFNAYPSAADRILMAKKSMMTPRQIEVWFQNHRNRARKEGKCLPRLHPSDKLPDLGLAGLEESMSDFIKSEPEKSNSDGSDSEDTEPRNQGEELHIKKATVLPNALEPLSSTHAFPSAYLAPPIPFSRMTIEECIPVFSGAPLPWLRSPSSPTPTPSKHRLLTKSQISELSDLFARLTVREGSRKVMRRKATPPPTKPSCGSSHAAACATTTVLHKGRHPSFVSTPTPPSSSVFSSFLVTDRLSSGQNLHPLSTGLPDTAPPPNSPNAPSVCLPFARFLFIFLPHAFIK